MKHKARITITGGLSDGKIGQRWEWHVTYNGESVSSGGGYLTTADDAADVACAAYRGLHHKDGERRTTQIARKSASTAAN